MTHAHIEMEFNALFNGLTGQEKMAITNHIFNNGLPGFPDLFKAPNGMRVGQNFLNHLPVEFEEPFSSIFYSTDDDFISEQIKIFVQKIMNDPIQNERTE